MTNIYEKNFNALVKLGNEYDEERAVRLNGPMIDDYKIRLEIMKVGILNQIAGTLANISGTLDEIDINTAGR